MVHRPHHDNPHRLLLSPPSYSSRLDECLSILFTLVLFVAISYLIAMVLRNLCRPRNPTSNVLEDPDCSVQLESIPVMRYGSRFSDDPCSICLAEYEEGEEIRVLPKCNHSFHKECIDRWLITRSSFCPICRDRVVERAVESATTNCRNREGESVRLDITMMANGLQQSALM